MDVGENKVNYPDTLEINEEGDEQSKNSRTPSGNILTDKVSNFCKLFSPEVAIKNKRKSREVLESDSKIYKSENQSTVEKLKGRARKLSQQRSGSMDRWVNKSASDHDERGQLTKTSVRYSFDDLTRIAADIKEPSISDLRELAKTIQTENCSLKLASKMKEMSETTPEASQKEADINMNLSEDDSEETNSCAGNTEEINMEPNVQNNPAVMSVITVQQMFASLKNQLDNLNITVTAMQNEKDQKVADAAIEDCTTRVLQKVSDQMDADTATVEKLKSDLKYFKRQNRTLTDVVQRMSIQMSEIQTRLENIEISTSKKAVSISGLYLDGAKHEMIDRLEKFLYNQLRVEVYIEDLFKTGSGQPKNIIAYFQSIYDKRRVMRNKYLLQNYRNKDDRKVFINDYRPTLQERRYLEQRVKDLNQQLQHPREITYAKGAMMIQGEIFKPKVSVPTPKQLVDLSPTELEDILKTPLHEGNKIVQEKSIFQAYTASVENIQEIRKLYIKMKLIQPEARHIVCAFSLPGEETHYLQSFCDDGEPTAGETILDLMIKNNIQNRVIFISRKYGGIRMGKNRFECYKEAALQVLKEYPRNSILKTNDEFKITDLPPKKKPSQKKSQRDNPPPPPPSTPEGSLQKIQLESKKL